MESVCARMGSVGTTALFVLRICTALHVMLAALRIIRVVEMVSAQMRVRVYAIASQGIQIVHAHADLASTEAIAVCSVIHPALVLVGATALVMECVCARMGSEGFIAIYEFLGVVTVCNLQMKPATTEIQ